MRPPGRKPDQIRAVSFERNYIKHAEGSCLVRFGDTHVPADSQFCFNTLVTSQRFFPS